MHVGLNGKETMTMICTSSILKMDLVQYIPRVHLLQQKMNPGVHILTVKNGPLPMVNATLLYVTNNNTVLCNDG